MTLTDIELPDEGDNIIRTQENVAFINPNGIGHEVYMSLMKNPEKPVQIDAVSGVTETCGEVLERSVRVACHLRKLGVTREDVISPCTTNHLNTNVVLFGILFTGAKPACMDPGAPKDEQTKQLKLVKPKFVFATPECVDNLENIIEKLGLETKIVVFGKTDQHMSFDEFLVPLPEEERNFEVFTSNNSFDTAIIVFSSGTTGIPKGICITHYQILLSSAAGPAKIPNAVMTTFASLVWVSALSFTLLSATTGQTKLLCSNFEVGKFWDYFAKYKVTQALLAPQDFVALVKAGKPEGLELPHLKMVAPAGGAISNETLAAARKMLPTTLILTLYGQTELWGFGLFPPLTPAGIATYMKKPGTCGKPVKGLTYKIVDPETEQILGPNQPGELRIKSKMAMNGYYKSSSHDRFDSEGFLKTGDIMYYDEDRWFFFVERCKEMLRYKMCTVAPTELESILVQHPSVLLAVVLGLPSDEGDVITAIVVKANDDVTAEELEDLIASNVDDRKRLRGGVKFLSMSEIPFTPSGKIRRRALRQQIIKQH